MEGPSSTTSLSNEDVKNLEFLLEAFGSKVSPDDMASAYYQSGRNVVEASEILYNMLGSSSNSATSQPAASVSHLNIGARSRSRSSGVSVGTVSGVIGADYGRIGARTKETREITKPVKVMLDEFVVSETGDEEWQSVSNVTTETMNKDVESFLFTMLGDGGFQLDMEAIRDVLGGCGYDVTESLDKLMNMSAPTLDSEDITSTRVDQTSTDTYQDLHSKFEENLQFSDSSQRSNLEKHVLSNLFTVSERSEEETRTVFEPRTRKYGLVTGPLEEQLIDFKTPIIRKDVNEDENEEVEDNYETLRQAVMEHWTTMKLYYRAAADAYVKGNIELSKKLVKEGHFYMAKAREADETSTKILTQNRDDGEVISIDLNDYDPKESVRLLKTQLKSMSGIPSIHYLKVMVGGNDGKNKPNARKRLISKLLQRDAITWTEEQDGQVMAIRIDVINRNNLSFNKK